MPVKKGEAIDPEATRRRVLKTAGRLFYARGTHPVGVNEIAETAGVSKLTLYRHFDSKEGLIRAFLEAHSDASIRSMELVAKREDLEAEERLLGLFEGLGLAFDDPRYRGCAMMNTAAEWRGSDSQAGELARGHIARIRELFARLCDEAELADSVRVADQLVLLLEGAIMLRMTRAAEDPAGDARAAAAALLAASPRR
jgi:AcrR family transcriptional regulator